MSNLSLVAIAPTVAIAATVASASANLFAGQTTNVGPANWNVSIANQSAAWAFVNFGTSSVTSVIPIPGTPQSGVPVPPNSTLIVQVPYAFTYAAVILASGTGTVMFTPCLGG